MSERKVLNKYYPPDFDPSKIPRMKLPKNRQYTVRLMAPFNMRCATCGEYIYRGKKFNARKEDVEGEDYCGIRIYRFYIKCTRCLQEISFKTDPENTDYVIEAGAIRNFMALKIAEETEKKLEEEIKEEEANNPMTLLENRTQQSKMELELMESLEELKDLNRRHYNTDFNSLLAKYNTTELKEKLLELQQEKDEQLVQSILGKRKLITEEVVEEIEEAVDESTEKFNLSSVSKPLCEQDIKPTTSKLSSGFSSGSTSSNLLGKSKQFASKFGSSSSSFGNSFGKSKPGTSKFANFGNFQKSVPSKLGSSSSSIFLASSKSETPKSANISDEKSSTLGGT